MQLHGILLLRTSASLHSVSVGAQPQAIKELVEGRIIT